MLVLVIAHYYIIITPAGAKLKIIFQTHNSKLSCVVMLLQSDENAANDDKINVYNMT